MVVVRLCGGIGNQLFQYGAARSLAARHRTQVVLDLSWFRERRLLSTKREYELWPYPLAAREPTRTELLGCLLCGGRLLRHLPVPRPWRRVRERSLAFEPRFFEFPDHVYLDGYWQSYRYVEPIRDELLRELTPALPMGDEDLRIAEQIARGNAVSVHIRRGDYLSNPRAAVVHGTCSAEYYAAALERVRQVVDAPRLFVFSDDPEWTRTHFRPPCETIHVGHNRGPTAFQDLRLMSMCNAHILANSSFSWWGAWLSANQTRLVVAPARWFAQGPDIRDLLPASWVRI